MKICSKCKIEQDFSNFSFNNKTKKYLYLCKNCNRLKSEKYRKENKEKFDLYTKEYNNREDIKERRRENSKIYREENKEKLKAQKNKWREENKEKLKAQKREYRKMKKNTDPIYRLHQIISAMIRKSLNYSGFKKNSRTHDILGCSFEEFKIYLESKFEDWMTWENRGLYNGELNYGWDIDHIIPLSTAETEEDVIKLNHYTNLQPLCSKFNRDIKKDNYEGCQY